MKKNLQLVEPHLQFVAAPVPPWPDSTLNAMTSEQVTTAEILTEGARHAVAHLLAQRMNEQVARAMLNQLRNHAAALAEEKVRRRLDSVITSHPHTLH